MKTFKEIEKPNEEDIKEAKDLNLYIYIHRHNLDSLDITNDVLLLSKNRHFYYEKEDMKKLVIHVKKLNETKKFELLIENLESLLDKDSIFCGRFIENNSIIFNKFSKRNFEKFLNSHSLKILNMTRIKNITYFYAKKV